jgi:diadenosine tetraphosphate (Ap4A) HIT family hydrolase
MNKLEDCAFCDQESLNWRSIRTGELFISFVSRPWFREGHCLVVPTRHITEVSGLTVEEGGHIMQELGRLSNLLDQGFGSGLMQKFQPTQAENGIKVNHLHFHVFPRTDYEANLFPVPSPNSFEGFVTPSEQQMIDIATKLRG